MRLFGVKKSVANNFGTTELKDEDTLMRQYVKSIHNRLRSRPMENRMKPGEKSWLKKKTR